MAARSSGFKSPFGHAKRKTPLVGVFSFLCLSRSTEVQTECSFRSPDALYRDPRSGTKDKKTTFEVVFLFLAVAGRTSIDTGAGVRRRCSLKRGNQTKKKKYRARSREGASSHHWVRPRNRRSVISFHLSPGKLRPAGLTKCAYFSTFLNRVTASITTFMNCRSKTSSSQKMPCLERKF